MNYHLIRTDDMLNGSGIRVVLFVSGCEHHCKGCHNPETWDYKSGNLFDDKALECIKNELKKDYIKGLTLSGGDVLYYRNVKDILSLVKEIKKEFPNKDIWLYTGYKWENIISNKDTRPVLNYVDVLVDGKFDKELEDVNYHWAGSTNQTIIDVNKSLKENQIILYK